MAIRLNNLAWVHRAQKEWEQAYIYFEKAYHIFCHGLGEGHPHSKTVKESLDFVADQLGGGKDL